MDIFHDLKIYNMQQKKNDKELKFPQLLTTKLYSIDRSLEVLNDNTYFNENTKWYLDS